MTEQDVLVAFISFTSEPCCRRRICYAAGPEPDLELYGSIKKWMSETRLCRHACCSLFHFELIRLLSQVGNIETYGIPSRVIKKLLFRDTICGIAFNLFLHLKSITPGIAIIYDCILCHIQLNVYFIHIHMGACLNLDYTFIGCKYYIEYNSLGATCTKPYLRVTYCSLPVLEEFVAFSSFS